MSNHCNENTTSINKEIIENNKMESQSNSINNIANNNNSNNQPSIINTNDYKKKSADANDYIRRGAVVPLQHIIQAPIVCPPGYAPDRNGKCRPIFY